MSNRSPKVVNKLELSFSSTKELNNIIDNALPGCPAFQCCELVIGGETLEFYHRDILGCIRTIYGDPEFAQDLVVAPERHYTDQGCHGSDRDACPQGRPGVARPSNMNVKNIGRKECRESRRKHVDRSDGSGREYWRIGRTHQITCRLEISVLIAGLDMIG